MMSNWSEAVAAMQDKGGWSSKGIETRCPRCHETGAMIETTIYGKTRMSFFCNVCAKDWDDRSYDDKQIGAPMITCQACGKAHYMVVPAQPCAACLDGA
jgi:ribosomal protein S27E